MNIGNWNPFLSFFISAWSWARPNSIHPTSRNRCPRLAPSSDAPWMATTTVGWYPSIRKVCATTHKSHYATIVFPPTQAQLSPAPIPVAVSVPISVAVSVFVSVSISFPSVNRRVCLSVFCIGASGKKRKMQLVIYGSHACVAFPYPVDGTSVQSGVY